jgi:hypothetical protein
MLFMIHGNYSLCMSIDWGSVQRTQYLWSSNTGLLIPVLAYLEKSFMELHHTLDADYHTQYVATYIYIYIYMRFKIIGIDITQPGAWGIITA